MSPDNSWRASASEFPAAPLLGHGAAGLGPMLYVFGGRSGGTTAFDGGADAERGELFTYNADADEWSEVDAAGAPQWPEPRTFVDRAAP